MPLFVRDYACMDSSKAEINCSEISIVYSDIASLFTPGAGFIFAAPSSKQVFHYALFLRKIFRGAKPPPRETQAPSFSDERRKRENRVPSPADYRAPGEAS